MHDDPLSVRGWYSVKSYDEKADVFSYGIVVCEIISRLDADPDEIPRMKVGKENVYLLWL